MAKFHPNRCRTIGHHPKVPPREPKIVSLVADLIVGYCWRLSPVYLPMLTAISHYCHVDPVSFSITDSPLLRTVNHFETSSTISLHESLANIFWILTCHTMPPPEAAGPPPPPQAGAAVGCLSWHGCWAPSWCLITAWSWSWSHHKLMMVKIAYCKGYCSAYWNGESWRCKNRTMRHTFYLQKSWSV